MEEETNVSHKLNGIDAIKLHKKLYFNWRAAFWSEF